MSFLIYTFFMTLTLSTENSRCVNKLYICFDVSVSVDSELPNLKNTVIQYLKELEKRSTNLETKIYIFDSKIELLETNEDIYETIKKIQMFTRTSHSSNDGTNLLPCINEVREQMNLSPHEKSVLLLSSDGEFHDWRNSEIPSKNLKKDFNSTLKIHAVASGNANFKILHALTNPKNLIYDKDAVKLRVKLPALFDQLCETFEKCHAQIPPNTTDYTIPKSCENLKLGEICPYSCNDTYSPSTKMVCNEKGWTLPICISGCPKEPKMISGIHKFKKLAQCDSYTNTSSCDIICDRSYEATGHVICINNQWIKNNASCDRIMRQATQRCNVVIEPIANVMTASLETCEGTYVGKTCIPVCEEGYISEGQYLCNKQDEWRNEDFSCVKTCSAGTISYEGYIQSCGERKDKEVCPHSCPGRFKKLDGKILCQNHQWTVAGKLCERTHCNSPDIRQYPNLSSDSCGKVEVGGKCTLHCVKLNQKALGYLTCESNGSFVNKDASCTTFCAEEYVKITTEENILCGENFEGKNCAFGCPERFKKTPNAHIVCTSTGWTKSPENLCERTSCGPPTLTDFPGLGSVPSNQCDRIEVGGVCTLDCTEPNQKPLGSLTCQKDGTYLNEDASCTDYCDQEEFDIAGTTEKYKCPLSNEGVKCSVKCPSNYKRTTNVLECKDKKWTRSETDSPICEEQVCSLPNLSAIENIKTDSKKCDKIAFGETCVPECNEGTSPKGSISCRDGSLITNDFSCAIVLPIPQIGPNSNIDEESVQKCKNPQPGGICSYDCILSEQHKFGNITLEGNEWKTEEAFCSEICDLQNLKEIKNSNSTGYKNCSKLRVGENCTVVCNNGHDLFGGNVTCLADHTLETNSTFCMPKRSRMNKIAETATPVVASLSVAFSGLTVGALLNPTPLGNMQAFVTDAVDFVNNIGSEINLDDPEIYIM